MLFPEFEITEYGLFDSKIKFGELRATKKRTVKEYEIELYTTDFSGETCIDDKSYKLKSGTLICAKPGQTRNSVLPFRCYYLHLKTENPRFRSLLDNLPNHIKTNDYSKLFESFMSLMKININNDRKILLFESCILQLLYTISSVSNSAYDLKANKSHIKELLKVKKYIKENLSSDLSLKALSQTANLSPIYFHNLFTQYFKITPNEYVSTQRISYAKMLLSNTEKPIIDISNICGFSSQSYFNYNFKKSVGQSPLQYRKAMQSRMIL
ncbi:MAG: helix-turn-helix transcriptional regulator [Clostridia bacterium]|nr:helix-turn-helix transcriptional regulator [Clostridia bacterium]